MPVPSAITDLSTTLASNSPAGSDNVFPDLDNYLRAHAQFVALLRDGRGLSTEVSLASAATCDIGGAASMFVQITGTTTITSFGTNYLPRILRFAGVLTLTHNATTLILPTGANITTAAGDMCLAVPVGTSGWRVLQYQRASEGADFVSFLQSGTGASSRTVQSKLRDVVSVLDFGADPTGVADSTAAIQAAINALGTSGGTITGPSGSTYRITDTLTFQAYGNGQAMRTIDFFGASIVYAGAINKPMLKTFNNRFLTIRNFTLDGANITGVQGIFCDSLQPLGSDHVNLENFYIKRCDVGVNLGSVGADQNRVSDSQIFSFLIESCNTGIKTNSTNVDSLIISTGIISGCERHIHINRAGFLKIDNVTGYGAKANAGINSFIYIDGPTGPLAVVSSQEENGGFTPMYFLRRANYTAAVDAPINLISCSADDDILFEAGAGSGSIVNVVGGYFNNFSVQCSDLFVNLIGTRQKAAGTLTLNGTNSFVRRTGSNIAGTQTLTNGFAQSLTTNGYISRPDGLIEQWGTVTPAAVSANSSRTDNITFPKTFPGGAVLNIEACPLSDGGDGISGWVKNNATASGFSTVVKNSAGVSQDIGVRWRALGY